MLAWMFVSHLMRTMSFAGGDVAARHVLCESRIPCSQSVVGHPARASIDITIMMESNDLEWLEKDNPTRGSLCYAKEQSVWVDGVRGCGQRSKQTINKKTRS